MALSFTGVALLSDQVPHLLDFYRLVLETEPVGDQVHAEFRLDGGNLVIYSRSAARADMGFSFDGYSGNGGSTVLMLRVDDVDAAFRRLSAQGIRFLTPPTTWPWGARSVHFRDPDGNIVDLVRPAGVGD